MTAIIAILTALPALITAVAALVHSLRSKAALVARIMALESAAGK